MSVGSSSGILRVPLAFYQRFRREGGVLFSAAVALYTLFALAPGLVLATYVAGLLLGPERIVLALKRVVVESFGEEITAQVSEILRASVAGRMDLSFGLIGIVVLTWSVWIAFTQLHAAMNAMWGVGIVPGASLADSALAHARRFAFVLLPAALLVLLAITTSVLSWVSARTGLTVLGGAIDLLGSPLVLALAAWAALFILYRFLPDVYVSAHDVLLPAAAVAGAWVIGTLLYGTYLARFGASSASGVAGAVFLLLVWMNYSARAVLLGCRWCRERVERRGSVAPRAYARVIERSDHSPEYVGT